MDSGVVHPEWLRSVSFGFRSSHFVQRFWEHILLMFKPMVCLYSPTCDTGSAVFGDMLGCSASVPCHLLLQKGAGSSALTP